jgi:quercetin dioxygenase-like cupin family protein
MMSDVPVQRKLESVEEEALHCGAKLRARFKMLFSADRTATDSLTCGVATVGPEEPLPRHRHAHSEIYFGIAGTARVTVGAEAFLLSEGTALFIPGNVEHAVHADAPATFFFAFAADSYSDVQYVYLDED